MRSPRGRGPPGKDRGQAPCLNHLQSEGKSSSTQGFISSSLGSRVIPHGETRLLNIVEGLLRAMPHRSGGGALTHGVRSSQ